MSEEYVANQADDFDVVISETPEEEAEEASGEQQPSFQLPPAANDAYDSVTSLEVPKLSGAAQQYLGKRRNRNTDRATTNALRKLGTFFVKQYASDKGYKLPD